MRPRRKRRLSMRRLQDGVVLQLVEEEEEQGRFHLRRWCHHRPSRGCHKQTDGILLRSYQTTCVHTSMDICCLPTSNLTLAIMNDFDNHKRNQNINRRQIELRIMDLHNHPNLRQEMETHKSLRHTNSMQHLCLSNNKCHNPSRPPWVMPWATPLAL